MFNDSLIALGGVVADVWLAVSFKPQAAPLRCGVVARVIERHAAILPNGFRQLFLALRLSLGGHAFLDSPAGDRVDALGISALPAAAGRADIPRASTRSPAGLSRKACPPRLRRSARKSWRKPFGRIAACRSITRATTPQRSGAACGLKLTASQTSATTPPRAMRESLNTTSSRPSAPSSSSSSRPSTSKECITT